MPIPGREFKAEMLFWLELTRERPQQANRKENGPNDDMKTMESRRHEKGRAEDRPFEGKRRVRIFVGLDAGESQAEEYGENQSSLQAKAVIVQERVMGPGHGRARSEKYERVEQREAPWIEDLGALGRPNAARESGSGEFVLKAGEQA